MSECTLTEMRDRLPDYAQGASTGADRARVEAHLAICEACRAEVALLRGTRLAILKRTPAVDIVRISAAVQAAGAPRVAPRSVIAPMVWRAAAAILVLAAGAYLYMGSRTVEKREQLPVVAHAPVPAPAPAPRMAPVPAPRLRQLAATPKAPRAEAPAGLSFGGVEDLSPAAAAAIMNELDHGAATLDAEPDVEIDLGSGISL